jgi:radical SAM superfamily enzyme YgiQ (UPF0313 family)
MFILFVQKSAFPHFGVMSISAVVKQSGHKSNLLLADEEKDLIGEIKKLNPDIVAFSCVTGEHNWVLKKALECKKNGFVTILGGPHPTYYPEDVINKDGVDIIAMGEAEYAVLELLDKLEKKEDITNIKNLWVKQNEKIYKNEVRNLIDDLDKLPFPDRSIYYKYSFLRKASVKQFLTGRGCPYLCSFCSNHLLQEIYKNKGHFVRWRSPKSVIDEIIQVKKEYGFKTISFTDDIFILNSRKWLEEFLIEYKSKINVPFFCNVRINLVKDEIIKKLKDYGCYGVSMGVESGNEFLRNKVLCKNVSNEQILNAGKIIKKHNLKLKVYNMLGLPGETFEQALETVIINSKIKPDFAPCSLLEPYPKYKITEYAKEKGYLSSNYGVDDVSESIYIPSKIDIKDRNKIINLQTFFFIGVKMPYLIPLIKFLVCLKPNILYRFFAKLFYGFFMSRVHRLTFMDIIRYAIHIDTLQV